MSNNNMEPAFLNPGNIEPETTNMVSFEAYLAGQEHHPKSKAFLKRNRNNLKRNIDCEEIILKQEPSNPFDSNAVMVLDASGNIIGYLDKSSAAILAKLKMKSFRGEVQSIDKDEIIVIKVVIETFLSIDDARDIITDNAKRFIARHYSESLSNAAFGSDPPTLKQFLYALNLGVDPRRKTFTSISTAIDKAKEKKNSRKQFPVQPEHRELLYEVMCSNSPADRDQLKDIKEWHGELLCKITRDEADDVIDFLEDLVFECPYCHGTTSNGDYCDMCGLSLRGIHIQIDIDQSQKDTASTRSRIHVQAILPGAIYKKHYTRYKTNVIKRGSDSAGCLLVLFFILVPVGCLYFALT